MSVSIAFAVVMMCVILLPLLIAGPLRRLSAQRVLRTHGGWLVAGAWLVGLTMIVAPLSVDYSAASESARGLGFAICLLGPLLIGVTLFVVRDGRLESAGEVDSEADQQVSPGVRIICGMMSTACIATGAFGLWNRDWNMVTVMLPVGASLAYAAVTGQSEEWTSEV